MTRLATPEGDRGDVRGLFLALIPAEVPEALADLLAQFPAWEWHRIEDVPDADLGRVREWASRWSIGAEWVVDHAVNFLSRVNRAPDIEPAELWLHYTGRPGDWHPPVQKFTARWDATAGGESRVEARKRIHADLERYFDRVEADAAAAGFSTPDRRDGGGNVKMIERVRWLVLHTAGGWSWRQIAETAGQPSSTVSRLATAVGKTLPL